MSSKKQAATATKTPVRNWTDEEKDLVWQQVLHAKEENLPLTEAFRRVAKILPHRSEAAVGMLYYNVLRKEREEEPKATPKKPVTVTTAADFKVDTRLLEAFQGLPEYIHELNKKMDNFEKRLQQPEPTAIIRALAQLVTSEREETDYKERLEILQQENNELKDSITGLEKELSKLRDAYDDALNIYDMFTNMASISQIMSLGDFKQQMKTTLDKWGNVLDISFDRVE